MNSVRPGSLCLALLSLGSLAFAPATADTISTWNGGSGGWRDASQWSPAIVPNNAANQAYDVLIGSGTVSLDINATINSLTLSGASYKGV